MRAGCALVVTIFLVLFALRQCTSSGDGDVTSSLEVPNYSALAPQETNDGIPFDVASDPGASYRLLKWSRMKNGHLEAITVRDGPSGMDFARSEISCNERTYRGLGEGETLQEAMKDSPNTGEMTELVDGSIAAVTVDTACSEARQ